MDLVKDLGDYLRRIAPEAMIRNGDYPREKGVIDVTIILSQLRDVEKVKEYYAKLSGVVEEIKRKQKNAARQRKATEEAAKDVPSLL